MAVHLSFSEKDDSTWSTTPTTTQVYVASGADSKVFIELWDTGCPGSTYTPVYDADKDMLLGVYYQAAQGQKNITWYFFE